MHTKVEVTQIFHDAMDVFAHRTMRDWTRFVKASGLSMPQMGIMMRLFYHSQCGVSEIGEHMEISAAATSQLVDKLVQHGLVTRVEDPNDRRAKQISLTEEGRALISKGTQLRVGWVDQIVSGLSDEEADTVCKVLLILTEKARQLVDE